MRKMIFVSMSIVTLLLLIGIMGCGPKQPAPIPDPPPVPENHTPVAYAPFTVTMDFSSGARVDYDLRYRLHGCDTAGNPTSATGARDPDGDQLEYKVDCKWTVFDGGRKKINRQWLTFPKDDRGEQLAIVTFFVGWDKLDPPYSFAPKCVNNEIADGCGSVITPEPFTYSVRDGKGAIATHTISQP